MKKTKKIILIVLCCIAAFAVISGVIIAVIANQPATIVTKYEKNRAKEIALLKKELGPGYIVTANSRAGYVQYTIMFMPGSEPYKDSEKFIKKYQLKSLFPKAEIRGRTGFAVLDFKREDYTKAVHYLLTKITDKARSIQLVDATVYRASSISYKPDISLHTKNPTKLEFERQDRHKDSWMALLRDEEGEGKFEVGRIITSKPAYDAYVDSFANCDFFKEFPEELETIKAQYSGEFFLTNALLVTKKLTTGKPRYSPGVNSVYLSDNKIYVVISRAKSEGLTIGVPPKNLFYITVNKDMIKGATELITLD